MLDTCQTCANKTRCMCLVGKVMTTGIPAAALSPSTKSMSTTSNSGTIF